MSALRRHPWLVFLLALSILSLSTRAKLAQYGPGETTHSTPQITKATKLLEGRQMKAFAVEISAVTPVPCPHPPHASEPRAAAPTGRTVIPSSCWAPASLRPPPAFVR